MRLISELAIKNSKLRMLVERTSVNQEIKELIDLGHTEDEAREIAEEANRRLDEEGAIR